MGGNDSIRGDAGNDSVVAGKADGATAGFVVEDALGRRFVLKADRPSQPDQATAADAIGAAGVHRLADGVGAVALAGCTSGGDFPSLAPRAAGLRSAVTRFPVSARSRSWFSVSILTCAVSEP